MSSAKKNFKPDVYEKALKKFSNSTYLGPFRASGYYVDDRRGDTVIECRNTETAQILADILNNLPHPDLLKNEPKEQVQVNSTVKTVGKITEFIKEETTESKIKKLL